MSLSTAPGSRLLLALRIERLKNPRAHSQHPRSSCQHVLQRTTVEADDTRNDTNDHAAPDSGPVDLPTPFVHREAPGAGHCRQRGDSASGRAAGRWFDSWPVVWGTAASSTGRLALQQLGRWNDLTLCVGALNAL